LIAFPNGLLEFDVLTSTTDPEKVVVVEAFKTDGGHTEHIKTPQVAAVPRDAFPLAAEKTFQNIFADRVEVDHG
jgi:quinol monooxygenase YgiN